MRKLKYYVACTVDGFIAAADGSIDGFLWEGEHLKDLIANFPDAFPTHMREALGLRGTPNKHFDTVLMGRRTWAVGLEFGVTSPYQHLRQFLFSRTLKASPDPDLELVSGDPVGFVRELKKEPGMDIWLCGGGELAATMFPEIDELILKVNPVVLGAGIQLFAGAIAPTRLQPLDRKTYENGFLLCRYRLR